MFKFLSILILSLTLISCGGIDYDDPDKLQELLDEALDYQKIQSRKTGANELYYKQNSDEPFTGFSKIIYPNGKPANLVEFKDGLQHGNEVAWYSSGQKRFVMNYDNGVRNLEESQFWKENGEEMAAEDGITNLYEKVAKTWINSTGPAYINSFLALSGQYPEKLEELISPPNDLPAFVKSPSDLIDPWGNSYQYNNLGKHNSGSFDLWSIAPNGDLISNW